MFEDWHKNFYIIRFTDGRVFKAFDRIYDAVLTKYQNDTGYKIAEFLQFHNNIRRSLKNFVSKDGIYYILLRDDQIGELMDRVDIHHEVLGEEYTQLLYDTLGSVMFHMSFDKPVNIVKFKDGE